MSYLAIMKKRCETEEEAQRFVDKNTGPDMFWEIEEEDPPPVASDK